MIALGQNQNNLSMLVKKQKNIAQERVGVHRKRYMLRSTLGMLKR
jgi:hypothetical protein